VLLKLTFLRRDGDGVSSQITVMKFGGKSVEDAQAFGQVAQIVRAHHEYPVVVVSAMSGVTDALIASLRIASEGGILKASQSLEEHFERHLRVTDSFAATARARTQLLVEHARQEILELLTAAAGKHASNGRLRDAIGSHGERLAANLLTIILTEYGLPAYYVDARHCILTDEDHGNARPLFPETWQRTRSQIKPLIKQQRLPVLGGFFAAARNGVTTTMGRGSSDYTATIISAALGASETQIWSHVDGVLTADPQLVGTARTVPQLSYAEATELARLGTKVLHPRMIEPLIGRRIPVRIHNSHAPERGGTLICDSSTVSAGFVKAIAHTPDVTTIDITSTPAFVANGFMRAIQQSFHRHQVRFDVIGASDISVSLACKAAASLPAIASDLTELGSVEIKPARAIVGCVGLGLNESAATARKVFARLRDIDPRLEWQSTSEVNLISTVPAHSATGLIRDLHQAFFE